MTHTKLLRISDRRAPSVLAIAGSDSSGGAGIQADLKALAALGVHGLSAITAVTAQNTRRMRSIHLVPAAQVQSQIDAAMEDFDVRAVKIGMLGSAATIRIVARFLRECGLPVVLDPVLVSSSGANLLPPRARALLRDELVPLAHVLTPNLPEAFALLGRKSAGDPRTLARDVLALGARAVLLKGGHGESDPVCDILVDAETTRVFRHPRLPFAARGTGCTLASAIAAGLARGRPLPAAVNAAERHLQRALRASYRAGGGNARILHGTIRQP